MDAVASLIDYVVDGNRVISAKGVPEDPVSGGQPCFKGLLCWKALYSGRITKPMKKKDRSGFVGISERGLKHPQRLIHHLY